MESTRAKSEQFRKSRKNFFKKAHKIGKKSNAQIFVLIKRNAKFYTFANTSHPILPSQDEIDNGEIISVTRADFEFAPKPKRKASVVKSSNALSTLGIEAPQLPQIDKEIPEYPEPMMDRGIRWGRN